MAGHRRRLWAAASLLAMLGCSTSPPAPERGPAPRSGTAAQTTSPSLGIAAEDRHVTASRLELRLAPAGPLARLGHHHVIVSRAVAGVGRHAPDHPEQTTFEGELAVASLEVDPPAERAAAGGVYAAPLDAAAIAGTREHMLEPVLLDGARFPLIGLRLVRWQTGIATMAFRVKGTEHLVEIPAAIGPVAGCALAVTGEASGERALTHAALGLRPYSALGGLLQVAEPIEVRFSLCFAARERATD